MTTNKWDLRYLDLAKQIATWSKDPRSQIGAVAVGEHGQVLSQGFNGFPRGIRDTEERLNDRETKLSLVVHAEHNCIYNAGLSGVSLHGSTIYVHGLPVCAECAKGIIQVGIFRVVNRINDAPAKDMTRWLESSKLSQMMFKEAGIRCTQVD